MLGGLDHRAVVPRLTALELRTQDIVSVMEPRFGAKGDGRNPDAAALQLAIATVKASNAGIWLGPHRFLVDDTLEYDTAGDGSVPGLRMFGCGMEHTELINAIAAGGPTINLTSGANAADLQFGGHLSGFKITEDGSGAGSHGIQYRGCWHQTFEDLFCESLNGSAFKVINTAGDPDSSSHVEFRNVRALLNAGPGFDSDGCTGGVAHHKLENGYFDRNGTANVLLEGVGHFDVIQCSITGQGAAAPNVPGVWLKAGAVGNRAVRLQGGEYGNNQGTFVLVDSVSTLYIGGMRFVRRSGETNSTKGIVIGDGTAGTVRGVTIDPIELQIDTATPAWTFLTIGTRLGTTARDLVVKQPTTSTFFAGNTYVAFASGAEDRPVSIEAQSAAGYLFAPQLKRVRTTYAAPGTITPDLTTGAWQQLNLTGVGAYTIAKPSNGNSDGAVMVLTILNNASGQGARVSFASDYSVRGYVDPGVDTTAMFRYDSTSAVWRQVGAWSSTNRPIVAGVGNVGGGEDDLITFTLPANTLGPGRGVNVKAWGTTANNSNPKTVRFYWGGTARLATALTVSQLGVWSIDVDIYRTGANTQKLIARLTQGGATTLVDVERSTPTETDTADIVIKCTGEVTDGGGGINNNDIVQEAMLVQVLN